MVARDMYAGEHTYDSQARIIPSGGINKDELIFLVHHRMAKWLFAICYASEHTYESIGSS